MQDVDYTYVNPAPLVMPTYTAERRTPLEYINRCFQIIGNQLPIRWSVNAKCLLDESKDALSGIVTISRGDFTLYDGVDCLYILEGLLKSLRLKISQYKGCWYIWNETDLKQKGFNGYQLNGTTVTTYQTNINVLNPLILGTDNTIEAQKGVSNVVVTYNPIQDINIIPNGNFNSVSTGYELYWNSTNSTVSVAQDNISLRLVDELGQPERSLNWVNAGELYFESPNGQQYIPIDGRQFPQFTMGFRLMPQNYPYYSSGEKVDQISWEESKPFSIQLKYTIERLGVIEDYYLNEQGYWVRDTGGNFGISNLVDIGNYVYDIVFKGSAVQGQSFKATEYIEYDEQNKYPVDTIINFTQNYDSTESTINYIVSQEPNMFQKINANTLRFLGSGNRYYDSPTFQITNGNGVTTSNWINFISQNAKNGDVIEYQFQSKANAGSILFPDCGDVNIDYPNGKGYFSIRFKQIAGANTTLDDLWLKFDSTQKTFTFKDDSIKSDKEEFELNIGSGFNGFELTSFANDFSNTDKQMMFRHNGKIGSLPALYGWDYLVQNKAPRLIFNCTLIGELKPFNIVTIEGREYYFVSGSYNSENNQTQAVLKEVKINNTYNITLTIS